MNKTKKLTLTAMFAALAYVLMLVSRVPITSLPFLKCDLKDMILAVCGFVLGPISALLTTLIVTLIEMVTVSSSGVTGFFMNLLSSACFVCPAAFIYKKRHDIKGAVTGLIAGVMLMTGVMLLWNYFLTPLYMGWPRAQIAELLLPIFLPFNLIKGSINAALTILIYKPISKALKHSGMVPTGSIQKAKRSFIGLYIAAFLVLISCIFAVLVLRGII